MLFSRGWGFSSDKETGVSACKQLPILVGETDNITIDEVPRMAEGDHSGKEAEEGEAGCRKLSGDIWAKIKGSQEHSGARGVPSRMARGDSMHI